VEDEPRPATWGSVSALLAASYGRTEGRWLTVPSGGALYGMVLHLVLRQPLGPLAPGIWWYDPWRAEVRPQAPGRPAIEPLLAAHPVTDPLLERGEPLVAISADLRRVARKYGARGYRLALMEAGAVMQTAYLLGAETGLPVRACAGFADAGVAGLLALPEDVEPLLLLFAGS
jgi:SagB-type dehydrogenase family enzyme